MLCEMTNSDTKSSLEREFAIWLLPEPSIEEMLSELVSTVAQRYGTVDFEPHLTLFCGFHKEEGSELEFLQSLVAPVEALTLCLSERKVWYTPDIYTQAMYLEFERSELATKHQKRILEAPVKESRPTLDTPLHLSLQYSDFSVSKKTEIREFILKQIEDLEEITFDRIQFLGTQAAGQSLSNLENWKVSEIFPLN